MAVSKNPKVSDRVLPKPLPVAQIGSRAASRRISTGDGEWLNEEGKTELSFQAKPAKFGGFATATKTGNTAGNPPEQRTGRKPTACCGNAGRPERATSWKQIRTGESLGFDDWIDTFLENHSKPPIRAQKTHEANQRFATHLKAAFSGRRLVEITAGVIEDYLRRRLRQRVRVKLAQGYGEKGILKSATVHQEFGVLRRMLDVAVRKGLLSANPCAGVEFPLAVKGLFPPHYVTWSEQRTIEAHAPEYLRNIVRITTETGLRVYKELVAMKKQQLDLANAMVWIPDSKTPNGVSEVPLTPLALEAFRDQMRLSPCSPYLFPSDQNPSRHQRTLKTAWEATLRRAKVPYFHIYDLRSTYAIRLSAGGVADEWVTQMLRQGDAQVFKKHSQMKLQMKREALEKLNRRANEMPAGKAGAYHEKAGAHSGTVTVQSV